MKKLYFTSLLALGSLCASAAIGDTTVLVSHNLEQLTWYGNYDQEVTFPDGSLSYRKIVMDFQLGKYACPGYNPNNPGEPSNGGTGWCGDWDYTIQVQACTPTDTIELGRLITPYANSNYPRTPLSWKHSYLFDVTDYYPLLQDDVTIRVHYSGYSGGFTATVKFLMIEGTRPRDVVGIQGLWNKSYDYGKASAPINDAMGPKSLTFPTNALYAEEKVYITGHGNDDNSCSEFCSKWYRFVVDGQTIDQNDIWRDDCGSNFLYPQSGTWIWDRGNWCPGDLVHQYNHKVPASVTPGSAFESALQFQDHVSTTNLSQRSQAVYIVSGAMVFYGAFNKQVDAGIEAIISPNADDTYYRMNPMCGKPKIKVKNFGGETITQLKFSYSIDNASPQEFEWLGSLPSLESTDIELETIAALANLSGNDHTFHVSIIEANGDEDEDPWNNTMSSAFKSVDQWNSPIVIKHKPTRVISGFDNTNTWTIYDVDGNVMATRVCPPRNNQDLYIDTVRNLPLGCYKLEVVNASGVIGLSFGIPFETAGYFQVYDLATGTRYGLPKNDLGNTRLAGNYGNGFVQYFNVSKENDIVTLSEQYSLSISPNPATSHIQVDIMGGPRQEATLTLTDILGKVAYRYQGHDKSIRIATDHIAPGMYTLVYLAGGTKHVEKVVIQK